MIDQFSQPTSGNTNDQAVFQTFLSGGGDMGSRMRAHDWTATPLGQPDRWPQSLRSAVGICLGCGFPIAIYWGPQLALLYNDAWSPIPADKHPWSLGRPGREVWPEIWDDIAPLFTQVLTTGEAVRPRDQLLAMRRRGFTEECYFDFTFSPIRNEAGEVGGIFNAAIETTPRVLGERRQMLLRALADACADCPTVETACLRAMEVLGRASYDVPFAMLYLASTDGRDAHLAAATGHTVDSPAAPRAISRESADSWPLDPTRATLIDDVRTIIPGHLYGGPWPEPVRQAITIPLARGDRQEPAGFLVAGLSPRLVFDAEYEGTLTVVADTIARAIERARAADAERKRAEQLAALDRAKTTFFSNVSHELRTPLTLLLSPLHDALETPENELSSRNRERLEIAHRNGLRLQKLVNALLDFSRLEAGRMRLTFASLDLAELTEDLAATFRPLMEQAGLTFTIDCQPLPENVWVDRDAWEKIVLNLLSNAFKFTLAGGIGVQLRAAAGQAELRVSDSGTGIPTAEIGSVFDRFHRIEGQRGRSMEGTGIGLALVQELVRLHNGDVRVESIEGVGSTFIVTIPFGRSHVQTDSIETVPTGRPSNEVGRFIGEAERWASKGTDGAIERTEGGPRVLVADDNADMRGYIARLLTDAGYVVESVVDGEAALAAAKANPPDLLISDVMMPRMDGFGLLGAIRSDSDLGMLPVILLSARAGEEARLEGLAAGADDYLIKPFSRRELLTTVGARLEITNARRASEIRHAFFDRLYAIIRPLRDPGEIVQAVTRIAGEHFVVDRCSYSEITADGTHAIVLPDFAHGELQSIAGLHHIDSYGAALMATVREGKIIAVADIENEDLIRDPAERAAWNQIDARGVLVLPLWKGQKMVANFFMLTSQPRNWQPAEIALASEIAEQTWSSLAAARAAEALRITEERARREAAAQRLLYDTALSNMPDFAYIFDLVGRFTYVNRAMADLLGRTSEQIIGRTLAELPYPAELAHKLTSQIQEVVKSRHPLRGEATFTSAAGETGLHEYILTPAFDAEGKVSAVVGSARDILAHVQANMALREADRRKDEFLAMLAHELRNPLASVSNAALLLRDQPNAQERTWATNVIVRQSQQLARLVDDLLDVSRITRGRIQLRQVRLDAALVLDRACETASGQISAREHTLSRVYPHGELWLDADPTRMEQIVVNLLINAARYTEPKGRISLEANCEGENVVINVQDTGIGMDPDRVHDMFELFTQGERSVARSEGGLGIGLTIVRALCELHGGSVDAHSEGHGRGSVFTVRLPAAVAPVENSVKRSILNPVEKESASILVVDDNLDTAAGLSKLLSRRGYQVTLAHDGPSALELAERINPAAVLLDIGLPIMDGYEVARELRNRANGQPTLIVAISGYGQDDDRARSLDAGCNYHLVKPIDFEELRRLLGDHLG